MSRLDKLRGDVPPRAHNARTIAALTANPRCARRAVLDCAGVDKGAIAKQVGFPARFGQSRFAITRGNAFERQVKADGCAPLLGLLCERLGVPVPEVERHDLSGEEGNEARHERTRRLIDAAAASGTPTLVDHPLLRLDVAGRGVYLEPDLVAVRLAGRFHVVEVKSFPVIDGQADPAKVAAAAIQSAVYVHAFRTLLAELGHDEGAVSAEVLLVCPRDFGNRPVGTLLDVRRQVGVLRRQLSRMAGVEELVAQLPARASFDLRPDADGNPTRDAADLAGDLRSLTANYLPACLSTCELAFFCRHADGDRTAALGATVPEELGGIDDQGTARALALGGPCTDPGQEAAGALLRAAMRLRTEVVGEGR